MAYITQAEKQEITPVIKALLKKYGLKGSLSIDNHSTIVLKIKSGKLDFIGNYYACLETRPHDRSYVQKGLKAINPNPYWFKEQYTGEVLEFLTSAFVALKGKEWFDHSDSQSDYFHTKHYVEIQCGTWITPYKLEA